jgi:hypothetical protein
MASILRPDTAPIVDVLEGYDVVVTRHALTARGAVRLPQVGMMLQKSTQLRYRLSWHASSY